MVVGEELADHPAPTWADSVLAEIDLDHVLRQSIQNFQSSFLAKAGLACQEGPDLR